MVQRLSCGASRKRSATFLLSRAPTRACLSTGGSSSSAEATDRRTSTRRTTSTPVRPVSSPPCSHLTRCRSLSHLDQALHLRYSPFPPTRTYGNPIREQDHCLWRRQRSERAQRRARARRLGPLAPRMDQARDAGTETDCEGLPFDEPRWEQVHRLWWERWAGVFQRHLHPRPRCVLFRFS